MRTRQTFNSLSKCYPVWGVCLLLSSSFAFCSSRSIGSSSFSSSLLSGSSLSSSDRISDTDRISLSLFSVSSLVTTRSERYSYNSSSHQN